LHEQLAGPVARARAAQRALSAGALASVTRVAFDAARVGGYLECTPEPAQSLLRELITGASPRDLLTTGRAPARLLEAVLSDFARRGGILMVETAGGIEDISQTRIPPAATPNLSALSVPLPEPETSPEAAREPEKAVAAPAAAPVPLPVPVVPVAAPAPIAVAEPEAEAPPVSQRKPPAIYSQPPDSELESADAGWFTFQIESSAQPPAIEEADEVTAVAAVPVPAEAKREPEPAAAPERPPVPRADDPLRKTLSSSAPPPDEDEAAPGTSVPVERGHRPPLRSDTLGSAGNEAAAALAAVAAEPVKSPPPRPAVKVPRPLSPSAPSVAETDALTAALSDETPAPAPAAAAEVSAPPVATVAKPTPATFGKTLPLNAITAPSELAEAELDATLGNTLPLEGSVRARSSRPPAAKASDSKPPASQTGSPRRSDVSTQPPQAAPRSQSMSSKAPQRTAKSPAAAPAPAAPAASDGGWVRTAVFALLAAGVSYFGVTKLFGGAPAEQPVAAAPSTIPPAVVVPVAPSAAPVVAAPKLQVTATDSPLPPGTDVPANLGLLEIQVPDGTAIRVDGEYLGMGPGRRVPLAPGAHALVLGEAAPQTVTIKAGQRTLAVTAGAAATPAPAGSP
jgi:hypothetical protein